MTGQKMTLIPSVLIGCAMVFSGTPVRAEESQFDQFFAPGNSSTYSTGIEPGHDGSPRVLQQSVRGSTVVSKSDLDTWTASARASEFNLSQSPVIAHTGLVVPESLWDVEGRLSFLHQLGDRRQWGGSLALGSASDKLFNSIHETEIQATGSYMIPSRESNAWLFLLNYSNNRSFLSNVPIPGVAYLWRIPDQGFQVIVGFPFTALTYRPNRDWNFSASVFGPTEQSAELARRVIGPVQAYLRYERSPRSWLRANRDNNSNQLIYDEKKTLLGLKSPLGRGFFLDLSGGRDFDRRFLEAKDATHTGAGVATLRNGWLVNAALSWHWGASANDHGAPQ